MIIPSAGHKWNEIKLNSRTQPRVGLWLGSIPREDPAGYCMKFDPRGGARWSRLLKTETSWWKKFWLCLRFYNHLSRVRQNIFGSFFFLLKYKNRCKAKHTGLLVSFREELVLSGAFANCEGEVDIVSGRRLTFRLPMCRPTDRKSVV